MNPSLQIFLCIAVVIVAAKFAGSLAARLGLPLVLGELLAGILLGPTWLNFWGLSWFAPTAGMTGSSAASVFQILADIGVVLLMFVAGLETDLKMMRGTVAPAFWAATGGVMLPMAGGFLLARYFGFSSREAIFIGTILTATSVTITAQTLMNLKQLKSKAGSTILGAAVIDDVLGLIVLSLVIALATHMGDAGSRSWHGFATICGRMAICLLTLLCLGPPITRWALKQGARLHGSHTEIAVALVIALLLAFTAEWLGGMAAITGAYLAGLCVAATPSREKVTSELQPIINSFFGPLFFVSIGLAANARRLGGRPSFFVLLLLVAVLGKVVGCGLTSHFNGFNRREALAVGIGMIPRGEVGLITAGLGWAAGLISQTVYVQVVVLVLATTLITPGLLKIAFADTFRKESLTDMAVLEAPEFDELPRAVAKAADA
jgi:Kef-type K+ transport system membrane component KefB